LKREQVHAENFVSKYTACTQAPLTMGAEQKIPTQTYLR
jgi:hypothetical protein